MSLLDVQLLQQIAEILNKSLQSSLEGDNPVTQDLPMKEIRKRLKLDQIDLGHAIPASPKSELLEFLQLYLQYSTHLHNPGFMSHQVSVPLMGSALADLINGATNNGTGVYEMAPAGIVVENFVVEWLLRRCQWSQGGGVLVSGGSLGNLTALLTARAQNDPDAWQKGVSSNAVFLSPDTSHYSVQRSVSIMGYGQDAVVAIATDAKGRVQIQGLRESYQQALDQGKKIIAVTANACATASGLYDPLEEIGEFCREKNLWLHVDAAHGGSALLSKKNRDLLKGLELANSLVWDMHKMLQTSSLCAAVLFRDKTKLRTAFRQKATYLNEQIDEDRDNMFDKALECTKSVLGLKFFINLLMTGEQNLADFVDSRYALAQEAHQLFCDTEGFSSPFAPESNIVLFRFGKSDDAQTKIYRQLIADGEFYISKTEFKGLTYLRLTLMNPKTTTEHLQRLLQKIKKLAQS